MSRQKTGAARAEETGGELHGEPLQSKDAAGLPADQTIAQRTVLPQHQDPRADLRTRMRELAHARVRYGYRRVHVLLRREGWCLGKNQMYRLYCEEHLQLRSKLPKRRKMLVVRRERAQANAANEIWSLDFVSDQLANGMRFRALTVVDIFTREALAIEVGQRLGGEHVVTVLNRLVAQRRAPKYLFVDNGSEFSGRVLDLGLITARRGSISVDPANRPTIATSKPSMDHCATNA